MKTIKYVGVGSLPSYAVVSAVALWEESSQDLFMLSVHVGLPRTPLSEI